MQQTIRVTVWCEHNQDRYEPVSLVYPHGMHEAIAEGLRQVSDFQVRTVTQHDPECGLDNELISSTDVLIWWSHLDNNDLPDDLADRVCSHVLNRGMGLLVLHSAMFSKPWQKLMGIYPQPPGWGSFRTMPQGERQRLWVITPGHPIVQGIDACIEIPRDEMYGEPLLIPEPDKTLFISWFEGGDVCRSGCIFERGNGKIFLFTPGHETFPIYYQKEIRQVLKNAVRWLAPSGTGAFQPDVPYRDGTPKENLQHRL